MYVLVIGSGGREHALIWKIRQSPKVTQIFAAPGNAGTAELAENVPIAPEQVERLADWAQEQSINLTVVGPEVPLTLGIVERFEEKGLTIFGPTSRAARLEGSKVFAKELMKKHGIPTAAFEVFADPEAAKAYVRTIGRPCVVKADGLAAGKGAVVCHSTGEAVEAIQLMMADRAFGSAGERVVIEEMMSGEEASVFAVTDGRDYAELPAVQDHKRALDGDRGKNTGGMGAYAPAPVVTPDVMAQVRTLIIEPTLAAMEREEAPYRGVLYCGLMLTTEGPKVVEFNCRFGDPECQVLMPLIRSDLVDMLLAVCERRLASYRPDIENRHAACVVMASGGYPDAYEKGKPISGLDRPADRSTVVFHSGTARSGDRIVTAGGRVLAVTSAGTTLPEALERCYRAVRSIHFDGAHYRTDIGHRALRRNNL